MAMAALLAAALLLPSPSVALTQDFCVADLSGGDTPAGYPCKRNVTADDFHYAGLTKQGPILQPFGVALKLASVREFPAMNGLHMAASRVDYLPGGVAPIHTHPRGTELVYVISGELEVGFVSAASNTPYTKTLREGEMFVFPQGLLHYQYNAGKTTAVAFAAYSSSFPGLQLVVSASFGNDLTTPLVEKITFVDEMEVRRLKVLFGGRG